MTKDVELKHVKKRNSNHDHPPAYDNVNEEDVTTDVTGKQNPAYVADSQENVSVTVVGVDAVTIIDDVPQSENGLKHRVYMV